MSYPLSIDEVSDADLAAEQKRRERSRADGICDYCLRKADASPCAQRERHAEARKAEAR